MNALNQYVDRKNAWNALFKGEQFTLETAAGRQRIASSLDADLSPENLTCDGELPYAEVQKRQRTLNSAVVQLRAIDPSVQMYEYE
jgi:hypothetical protein